MRHGWLASRVPATFAFAPNAWISWHSASGSLRGLQPAEMSDVFVAVRAFRRYRMLMITLERIGIRHPATYAAAARLASRMSPPDPARAFVAIAQFQGALALLQRMRMVGTLDVVKTEALVGSLLAVPLNSDFAVPGRRPAMDR